MFYENLRKSANTGWNTWNTASVLSHVLLPYGFAINLNIKELSGSSVIRNPLVGRFGNDQEHIKPGARSWDGTYTNLEVSYLHCTFKVESTVNAGEQYILVTPVTQGRRPPVIIVEACILWGRDGTIGKQNGMIYGEFGDRRINVYSDAETFNYTYGWSTSPCFAFSLEHPTAISTVPCSADEARILIDEGKRKTEAEAAKYGDTAEVYTAMKCCLAWDTIYESENDRICSPVSRIWNMNWGGYVLFDWDTYFASEMASVDNKALAYLNCYAITHEITEDGFIPNFGCNDNNKSRDRSQPPVGSAALLRIFEKYPEPEAVRELYPYFIRWNRWYSEKRTTPEGYMCWGSNKFEPVSDRYWELTGVGDRTGAALESGLDNSPMYDDMAYDESTEMSCLADVGLMGLYIRDCECLIKLAGIAGYENDIPEIESRRDKVENALMNLWSEEDGIFENLDLITGKLSKRISPTNFYALYSRRVTVEMKTRMMNEHFYNPEEFWGDYIIPSISRNDPGYPDQSYWRGRIWAPMNYLVYEAMRNAGLDSDAHVLAEKSGELLLKEWREHGHVHENYSGDDGWGCGVGNSDKFYHWGGLLGFIAINDRNTRRPLQQ